MLTNHWRARGTVAARVGKMRILALLCILASTVWAEDADTAPKKPPFAPPSRPKADIYFYETFNSEEDYEKQWVESEATKDGVDTEISKYDGEWAIESPIVDGLKEDRGLVMKLAAKHYATSAMFEKPFTFDEDNLIIQYEVNFQEGLSCGGAYVKLLSASDTLKLENVQEKTPYTIMFGPDKCGNTNKIHFIFRHKNPVSGKYEEKHAKTVDTDMGFFDDKKTHIFRLVVKSDNNYNILVDEMIVSTGSLLEDFTPPVNPPKEIDDPDDKKPSDWDEREKIPDPSAKKPDDWDEDAPMKIPDPDAVKPEGWLDDGPEYIPDPDASQPDDWDEEEDGEWEAPTIPNPACEEIGCGEWKRPLIANPAYKGKWSAPVIDNPAYQGIWAPRKIPNPDYFEDNDPYKSMTPIGAIALELWTMSKDIYFDNFIVTSELTAASVVANDGWRAKVEAERGADPSSNLGPFLEWFVTIANERPYLWLLYVIVLVMPFVLCAACCVRSKPTPADDAAKRKKTDEPAPDDETDHTASADAKPADSFVASAEDEEEEEVQNKPEEAQAQAETENKSASNSRPESRQSSTKEDKQSGHSGDDETGGEDDEISAEKVQEKAEDEPSTETTETKKGLKKRKGARRET